MDVLQDYKFNSTYELAHLIDGSVRASVSFWNFDEQAFIDSSTRYKKDTLLHLYIVVTAVNYHHRDFIKNGDSIDEEIIEGWYRLFDLFSIKIKKFNFEGNVEIADWFEKNIEKFEKLFDKMADEVFYVLFSNRGFLLEFNNLVAKTIQEDIVLPQMFLTKKGTLKRINIPQWVKDSVFHREKGRCVFCNTDLTRLINTLTNSNYDHIVPLDLFGSNDPCNIQLSCEHCNKSKTNKNGSTSTKYIPWWVRE